MNPDILRDADPHIREEWWKLRASYGAVDRGLELAVRAFLSGRGRDALPGDPPADDAPLVDWLDYFVGQGWLVQHAQLPVGAAA